MQKKSIQINEQNLERIVNECVREVVMEAADEGKVGNWLRSKFGRNQEQPAPTGTQSTDYSRMYQANDPFAAPKQHPMTDYQDNMGQGERQAVDAANQRSDVFQARERVKELINGRKDYISAANRCMGRAKNLCKQYGLNLGEIMKEMGITNNTTKKYDASVDANNMAMAIGSDDAIEEGKKTNKRLVNESQIKKIIESIVRKRLSEFKK